MLIISHIYCVFVLQRYSQATDFDEDFLMKSVVANPEQLALVLSNQKLSMTVTSPRDCDVTTLNDNYDDVFQRRLMSHNIERILSERHKKREKKLKQKLKRTRKFPNKN